MPAFLKRTDIRTRLESFHPAVRVEYSKRAKRLALRLDAKDRIVRFVIPQRASLKKAQAFLLAHEGWISEKIDALPARIPFRHGAILPVFGEEKRLFISYDKTLKRTNIFLKENELFISTNKDDPSTRIERYLINQAKQTLTAIAHEKADLIGKAIKTVQVRDTKSRWGSCADGGRISFSWRLIFAPWHSLDYVVAHEVAHLVHMHHGPEFWALCAELSTDYARGKRWMRTHGHTLMRYG